MRRPAKEWQNVSNWYGHQKNEFSDYVAHDPIFQGLYSGAAKYFNQGPSPLLSALQKQGLSYVNNGPSAATNALTKLGVSTATAGPSPISKIMQSQAQEDLLNRGALDPALNRDVRNETLATAGNMGMGNTTGTLGTELLNREKYREQREQIARQYGGQAEQVSQADLASRLGAGQIAQGADIQDAASRFGIGGQVQGLTQADTAQRFAIPLSVAGGATSDFSALTNPILSYMGNLFSGNQQAATQAAVGNSQAGAANKSGQSGLAGSAIGAIGSIAGAVLL
jgi:hypothetical protein